MVSRSTTLSLLWCWKSNRLLHHPMIKCSRRWTCLEITQQDQHKLKFKVSHIIQIAPILKWVKMWQTCIQTKWCSRSVGMNHQMVTLHLTRTRDCLDTIVFSWNKLCMAATQMSCWWKIETDLINSYIWWNKLVNQLKAPWLGNWDVTHMNAIMDLTTRRGPQALPQEPTLGPQLLLHLHQRVQVWVLLDSHWVRADKATRHSFTISHWPTTSCRVRTVKTNWI